MSWILRMVPGWTPAFPEPIGGRDRSPPTVAAGLACRTDPRLDQLVRVPPADRLGDRHGDRVRRRLLARADAPTADRGTPAAGRHDLECTVDLRPLLISRRPRRPSRRPATTTTPPIAVVHVAGAVVSAGLYQIEAGARVGAAITLAGGPTPDAAIDVVNLAAVVVDGSRIYVPRVGESIPPEVAPAGSSSSGSSAAGADRVAAPGSSTSTSPRSMNSTSSRASARPPRRRSSPSANATVRSSTSTTSIGCPASARPSSRRCAIW